MIKPAGRRKIRKRKAKSEKMGVKLSSAAVIMLVAVFLGFLTARFVIGPIIGYNADESEIRVLQEDREKTEEDNDDKEESTEQAPDNSEQTTGVSAVPSKGYALQFGAFSTEDAARSLADTLISKGIETEIIEADGIFKVISTVVDDKDEALSALEKIKENDVKDAFITSFQ